jgi:RimJ/RimL family protein N-acetyltransferase
MAFAMIDTQRLRLVPLSADHFEPLAAMYADPEVIRFLEAAPLDRDESWRRLAFHFGHWALRGYGNFACLEKASGTFVISLVHPDNVRSQRVAERGGAKLEKEIWLRGHPARLFVWPER